MPDVRSGLDPVDYRFLREKADPDFSPERNKAIIKETIKDTERYFENEAKIVDEAMKKRIDVLSSFARHNFNKSSTSLKKYLGDKLFYSLIGEKILSKLRVAETVNRLNGNSRFKKGILL